MLFWSVNVDFDAVVLSTSKNRIDTFDTPLLFIIVFVTSISSDLFIHRIGPDACGLISFLNKSRVHIYGSAVFLYPHNKRWKE